MYRCFIVLSAATALLVSLPALALTSLEELVVTARKREVSLQEAPVAISVLSGEDFDKSNIVRLDNFNGYVPGLVVAKNDGAGRVVTIRGIGWETAQNLATQPSVLTYIDGVYLANPLAMGLDLGELERVEVLRGPQGTEFGQGATGGAINIVTRKPLFDGLDGAVELSYGNYDNVRARASINIPLADTWALRAALQKYQRDGFAQIRGGELDGYELDDADSFTGKLAALWQPSDNFSAHAQVFLHDADHHAAAQKNINDPNPNPRELSQDYPGIFALENYHASLILEWTPPADLKIRSLTGWQRLKKRQSVDGDRLNEQLTAINSSGYQTNNWDVLPYWDNDSSAVSQEFNLSYAGAALDWVAGAYYLHHENFNDFLEATGVAPFADSPAALPRAQLNAETLPPFASALNFTEFRTVTRDDYALYAQGALRLNQLFTVTAGVRYQQEEQRDQGAQFFGVFGAFDRNADDHGLTWKAGVDVQLTPERLIYGLVSTGWKNGGAGSAGIFKPDRFQPEAVTAFELGTRNTLLDGRVRLNLTAFYYDHEHLQFTYEDPAPFAGGTWTIPETEEYGIEAELDWLLSDNWRLDAALAWQDGRILSDVFALDVEDFRAALRSFQFGLFTPGAVDERIRLNNSNNLKGNQPPKLVELSARIALSNNYLFSDGSALNSRLEYIHRGEFQARVFNHPVVDTVPDYNLVNLYFSYQPARLPLSLSLSVTNVFDEDGINNVFTNPYGLWTTSNEYIPPREVIGSVKYSWN